MADPVLILLRLTIVRCAREVMQNGKCSNVDPEFQTIWEQTSIPVVIRKSGPGPVLARLPYAIDNRSWLQAGRRTKPKWNKEHKRWEIPKAWFENLISTSLKRYGQIYVAQLYQEQQKCAPACWNAAGFHCECSCMGEHHGTGQPDANWHEVSETFGFRLEEKRYACRLITRKNDVACS